VALLLPKLENRKLRWCTERRRLVVEFWLALANAAIVCGRLVGRAWIRYRWDGRPAAGRDHLLAQALRRPAELPVWTAQQPG
jgi:hypothetical protein